MSNTALQIALEYANKGWPVFPCLNKKPMTPGGFKDASTDAKQIKRWWTMWAGVQIGIPTGQASGLVVIDVDVRNGVDGFESLKELEPLPKTLMVRTPSGGAHFIFKHDPDRPLRNSANQLGPGLDVRGEGGYIIAAGSVSPGGVYEVIRDLPIAPCPEWIGEVLQAKKSRGAAKANPNSSPTNDRYLQSAIHGEVGRLATAPAGQRNEELNRAAFSLGTLTGPGGLTEQEAHLALMSGATACGLLADDGANAVQATIRSGLGAGMANPRQVPAKPKAEQRAKAEPKPPPTPWRERCTNGLTLLDTQFVPVSYLIPGIVPEGLSLLAGKPKLGKSWLTLGAAIAVATGGHTLGQSVEQGDVLFLALEDNQRRLKKRLVKLMPDFADKKPLDRMTIATTWRKSGEGLIEDIEDWCKSVPKPRLIVIDTLGKVRANADGKVSPYQDDVAALGPIHELANARGLAVIVVHHVRKMDAEDPLDTVSGTTGLSGTADTILVLDRRQEAGLTLKGRGRDLEEDIDLALDFDRETCRFDVRGSATEVRRSTERTTILDTLKEAPNGMTPAELTAETEMKPGNVRRLLGKMVRDGQVIKVDGKGKYLHPDAQGSLSDTGNSGNSGNSHPYDDDDDLKDPDSYGLL